MKVLVTGASGGLGARLLPALCAVAKVRALVHKKPVAFADVEPVAGDLSDLESLRAAAAGVDRVLHLAAQTNTHREQEYFDVNVQGTENLLTACTASGVARFVFMSSGAAHADGGAYSLSKLEAEARVRAWQGDWVILRAREVYGPDMTEGLGKLTSWIDRFGAVPVIGDGRYQLAPVHVDDVVQASVQAVRRDGIAGDTITLAGPESLEFIALVDRLGALRGKRPKKIFVPAAGMRVAARLLSALGVSVLVPDQVDRLLCDKPSDNSAAARLLDFKPRSLEAGLGATPATDR